MSFSITTATKRVYKLDKRIKAVQGGTSAGKTVGIVQVLIDKCQRDNKGDITSIVSESLPHLKRGAMRDFKNIMEEQDYFDDDRWNRSDMIYTFENGAMLEFFSADQPTKVRGPRRKRLFINEANNIPLETFEQLEVRTTEEIYLDWNPTNEFWFYTDVLPQRDDVDHIILTYKDNEALDERIVQSIESRKGRKGWWKVYGMGELGEVEGKIYPNWPLLDDIPQEARLERRYIDFGYTNDPTAIGDVYYWNGSYIVDEIIYQQGMSNKQIAELLLNHDRVLTIADSAEPKSIDEIKSFGIPIIGATKGRDSIIHGISNVKDQNMYVTKRSLNIIKENRNYLFMVDKDGRALNQPDPMCEDHHMDGIRYAMGSLVPVMRKREMAVSLPAFTKRNVNSKGK